MSAEFDRLRGWQASVFQGWAFVWMGLALGCTGLASAAEARLERTQDGVQIDLQAPELFRKELEPLLDSGFELVLGYSVELLATDGRVLATGRLRFQAAFDLWNEEYSIALRKEGVAEPLLVVRSRREALEHLRNWRLRLRLEEKPPLLVRLRVRARLEPVGVQDEPSENWLDRPMTGADEDARGANLFTAFAQWMETPKTQDQAETELLLGPWPLAEVRP